MSLNMWLPLNTTNGSEILNNGLKDYNSNILFASHDHQFIQTIANRIIDIKDDGSIVDRTMTFDEYIEAFGNN